ncbi:MAG: hypothetical protein RMJ55_04060 [Roseiflexaceae bacterium]|nr:hypothetical protein [Roseiflexaceae bacterium]
MSSSATPFTPTGIVAREISATVILPSSDELSIRLAPIHLIQQLEEYRADEAKVHLLVGLFGGAVLGILGNWATSDLHITLESVFLLLIMILLTGISVWWLKVIDRRIKKLQDRIFNKIAQRTDTSGMTYPHQ